MEKKWDSTFDEANFESAKKNVSDNLSILEQLENGDVDFKQHIPKRKKLLDLNNERPSIRLLSRFYKIES
jgi:hypothetical protein